MCFENKSILKSVAAVDIGDVLVRRQKTERLHPVGSVSLISSTVIKKQR